TVRATVPEGTGTVYLTGNLPELGPWRPDGIAMTGEGRERMAQLSVPLGTTIEYKFTLGSWDREALGPSGTVPPNHQLLIDGDVEASHDIAAFKKDPRAYIADWKGSGVLGRLVYWTDVSSAHLGPTRHVEIWLPPGYDEDPSARYPVLYMHDGQNLFDPRMASTGVDWGVDEAVVRLVEQGVFGATGHVTLVGANPFSSEAGIASIVVQTETRRPRGAVYALCVVRDDERVRVLSDAVSVGGDVEPYEVRVTSDGSEAGSGAPRYAAPFIASGRVRAALSVAGSRVVTVDTDIPKFRIAGSTAPS
ncbi:MAG: hypothetical protein OEO17_11415, partial [Gemmatimonadota bacterium]|nr:hypothetical protein [Gemmatimonadota bacterium]